MFIFHNLMFSHLRFHRLHTDFVNCRRRTLPVIAFAVSVFVSTVSSANTSEINWDDLLSPEIDQLAEKSRELQDHFKNLSAEDQTLYRSIADELMLRDRLEDGSMKKSQMTRSELDSLESGLSEQHPDAVTFWGEVKQLNETAELENSKVNPELNGKSIRMPGYVLPLQSEDGKVFEFMLVPYVGACVHTPPPPLNQLVFVKSDDGFPSEDLFTPVWVEGVMSTKQGNYDLSYRDGIRDVEAGYTLDAELVEVYKQ